VSDNVFMFLALIVAIPLIEDLKQQKVYKIRRYIYVGEILHCDCENLSKLGIYTILIMRGSDMHCFYAMQPTRIFCCA